MLYSLFCFQNLDTIELGFDGDVHILATLDSQVDIISFEMLLFETKPTVIFRVNQHISGAACLLYLAFFGVRFWKAE